MGIISCLVQSWQDAGREAYDLDLFVEKYA